MAAASAEKEDTVALASSRTDGDHDQMDAAPVSKLAKLKRAIVVIAIVSSTFFYALDNTIMANIRPGIVDSLGHVEMLSWMTIAYPLGEVGSCLFWGGMSQRYNNKWLYLAAVLLFEAGSAISGAAPSMEVLIFSRVLAGLGGSGIYVGAVNIITLMSTTIERSQYLSFVGMAWSLGTILGPIIGGAFSDSGATWRWAFYINLCFAAPAVPAWLFLIPSFKPDSKVTQMPKGNRLDFVGLVLFTGSVASVILILGFGGAIWEYTSTSMIILYTCLGVCLVSFVCQQWWKLFTGNPIFPIHFFEKKEFLILFLHSSIAIADIVVTMNMLPLFFQFVYGDSTVRSGLYVLAVSAAGIVAAGGGGAIFPKLTLYPVWFIVADALMIIGAALLTTASATTSRAAVCGFAIVNLVGGGLIVQLPFTIGQVKAGPNDVRSVNTLLVTAQMFAVAVSLGMATTIFFNITVPELSSLIPAVERDQLYAYVEGVGSASLSALPDDIRKDILEIVAKSVVKAFYMLVAGGALGLLTAVMLDWEHLVLPGLQS